MKEISKEKFNYLYSLLSENEKCHLLRLKDEWYDFDYNTDEEIIEDNLSIDIIHKGYDVLAQSLFIQVAYVFAMTEFNITVKKNIGFDVFENYYEFLEGDIYDNACYYGYEFTSETVKRFNIDLNLVSYASKITRTISLAGKIENAWSVFMLHWTMRENRKNNILKYMNSGCDLNKYLQDRNGFPKMDVFDFDILCRCLIARDPDLIIKKHDIYPAYDDFWIYAGCKKDNAQLQQLEIGFDSHTHMFYRTMQTMIDNTQLSFKLYYPTIDALAAACNNNLASGNFAPCCYHIDWNKYNTENAELPTNTMVRRCHVKKRDVGFDLIIEFLLGSNVVSIHTHTFDIIVDVMAFLEMDIEKFSPYLEMLKNHKSVVIQNV